MRTLHVGMDMGLLSDTSPVEVLRTLNTHLCNTEGAWAQLACAKHLLLTVRTMGVDLNEGIIVF